MRHKFLPVLACIGILFGQTPDADADAEINVAMAGLAEHAASFTIVNPQYREVTVRVELLDTNGTVVHRMA